MIETRFHGRAAHQIENDHLRVTVLDAGGHVAEIVDKSTGVNPLWTPHWRTIDPDTYDPRVHTEYGDGIEAALLCGIAGHNVCLDIFGPPSPEEIAAGLPVHGEGSTARYSFTSAGETLVQTATLRHAQLGFERRLTLDGRSLHYHETVENLAAHDRPLAWTEHISLGAPFLERGRTRIRLTATRSKVFEGDFAGDFDRRVPAAEFAWPLCPARDGSQIDLSVYESAPRSGGFSTHLMDPARATASFTVWSPGAGLAFGCEWDRADFPWLGRWEENCARTIAPWHGREMTLGMEFGVSPFPESRRAMVDRGSLFGVPAYRWIQARTKIEVRFRVFTASEFE